MSEGLKATRKIAAQQLARKIAAKLFINGFGEQAERLVLESPEKKNLGGWCRQAVEDRVREIIEEAMKKARSSNNK